MYESIVALTRELNVTVVNVVIFIYRFKHVIIQSLKLYIKLVISIIHQKSLPQGAIVCEATSGGLALYF